MRDERRLVDVLRAQARELAESLERDARSRAPSAIKIKRADFTDSSGVKRTWPNRRAIARRIFRAAVYCLRRAGSGGEPVRLLGTRVASLVEGDAIQTSLF